jgi:hypothetical protein
MPVPNMLITSKLHRLPILCPNTPIHHLWFNFHKLKTISTGLLKEVATIHFLSTFVIFVLDNEICVVQPAVDKKVGRVFSDPLSELRVGFDEVDEVPCASFVVGFWVFERIYLIAAERLLIVGRSSGVSGKRLTGEYMRHP